MAEEDSSVQPNSWSQKLMSSVICKRDFIIAIGLGQTLSLLICGTAVTSGILGEAGVTIPTAQSFLNYVALCVVYTSLLACQKGEHNLIVVIKQRGLKYLLLAFIDVEANYLIVKAYHYTTVTSVQLLDCFTIPTVLFCSWCFLRVRYKWSHFLGVFVCLLGVGALILADVMVDKYSNTGTNKILGDFLCLFGATCYGLSNVGQEYVVKSFSRFEFLGMIGLFGSFINGIQFAVLERKEISNIDFSDSRIVISLLGFAVCLFALYSLMPLVIERTSATAVNLNLLSADFYALLVGLFLFHYKFHVLYFVSFAVIILGLFIYSARAPPVQAPPTSDYLVVHVTGSDEPINTKTQLTPPGSPSKGAVNNREDSSERTSLKSGVTMTNYVEVCDHISDARTSNDVKNETIC